MSEPRRIQRKRTKGWRKPAGAISVCRPGKWGNPFKILAPAACELAAMIGDPFYADSAEDAVAKYSEWIQTQPKLLRHLVELRGHDLMCFCAEDSPCHADVLLRLANEARDV